MQGEALTLGERSQPRQSSTRGPWQQGHAVQGGQEMSQFNVVGSVNHMGVLWVGAFWTVFLSDYNCTKPSSLSVACLLVSGW